MNTDAVKLFEEVTPHMTRRPDPAGKIRPRVVRAYRIGDRYDVFVGGWRVASLKTEKGALRRARKEADRG